MDLGDAIFTATRLKLKHIFSIRFYFWWDDRTKEYLVSEDVLNQERNIKNIHQDIFIILSKQCIDPMINMVAAETIYYVRGCLWFLSE